MFDTVILHAMLLFVPVSADALDIVFPPVSSIERSQKPFTNDDGIDITIGSDFSGLMTFANLPYVNCFKAFDMDAYDIAIMGAPFDTVSTPHQLSFPVGIRNATRRISLHMYLEREKRSIGTRSGLLPNTQKAVTARPGARFGPTGIRRGSRRMSASFGWSIYNGENLPHHFILLQLTSPDRGEFL